MAKRIGQSSVNWAALAERVPPEQRAHFTVFKVKSDGYLRRVMANPPEAPKIDWAKYKQLVPIPGMVDKFQKQYEALKIPYPTDTMSSKVEAQRAEVKKIIEEFVKDSNASIAKYEAEIAATKALLPFDQMTAEDFRDAYPHLALDPINRPTFWPHEYEEEDDTQVENATSSTPAPASAH